ncbi:unnamed protein product [Rotaria magnacalcarata]|uniref:Uncharacterized protein n=1 Tax=Rotaria magnacalcarata TaxID=392030 RepID=A0A816TV81_9BILA|nr:unnamed protein product [Rotaria magnacalcarata]CAF3986002.1 unnamed protein product [Rotaria magnacalcarata]
MSEVEIALQYAKNKKNNRLRRNNINRLIGRFKANACSCSKDSMDMQSSVISSLSSMTITTDDVNNKIQPNELLSSISNFNENNSAEDEDDLSDNYDFTDLMHYEQPDNLNLHAYTSINCLSFSHNVINFIRNANISKSHAQQLIDLIQSGLPQPNNLPIYYLDVLELLSGLEIHCFFFD